MGGGTGSDDSSKLEKLVKGIVSDIKTFAIGTREELKKKQNELYLFLNFPEVISVVFFATCIAKGSYQKALYFAPLFIDDAVRVYNYLRHQDEPHYSPGLIGTIRGYLKKRKEKRKSRQDL